MGKTQTQKIKILHLIDSLPLEGAEILLYDIIQRSDRELFDFQVCALTKGGGVASMLEQLGIPVFILGRKSRWDLKAFISLGLLIRQKNIQIIHSHIFSSHLWGALAGALTGTKTMRTEHNMSDWKRGWRARVDWVLSALTTKVIAVSDPVRKSLIEISGFPPQKVKTVTNGLNLQRLDFKIDRDQKFQQLGLPKNCRVGAICAALTPKKGHSYLIEAIAMLPERFRDFHLIFLGEGELFEDLTDLIKQKKLQERISLLGSRTDALEIISLMDVFVMSSIREGLSIALLEAMALARPVVVTAVGGAPEVVNSGSNGILVPPENPEALSQGIAKILDDPQAAQRMGIKARKTIEENFSFNRMVEDYQKIYLELL